MLATHRDAECRYEQLREKALQVAQRRVPAALGVRLCLIDEFALHAAKEWTQSLKRIVDWDWKGGYRDFAFRYPKRFELAIWHKGELINLSLGRPTFHGGGLRLDFIEARPEGKDIQVFPIILLTLNAYAAAIGAKEIRLVKPINDNVKSYYEKFGFIYVKRDDYLYIKL